MLEKGDAGRDICRWPRAADAVALATLPSWSSVTGRTPSLDVAGETVAVARSTRTVPTATLPPPLHQREGDASRLEQRYRLAGRRKRLEHRAVQYRALVPRTKPGGGRCRRRSSAGDPATANRLIHRRAARAAIVAKRQASCRRERRMPGMRAVDSVHRRLRHWADGSARQSAAGCRSRNPRGADRTRLAGLYPSNVAWAEQIRRRRHDRLRGRRRAPPRALDRRGRARTASSTRCRTRAAASASSGTAPTATSFIPRASAAGARAAAAGQPMSWNGRMWRDGEAPHLRREARLFLSLGGRDPVHVCCYAAANCRLAQARRIREEPTAHAPGTGHACIARDIIARCMMHASCGRQTRDAFLGGRVPACAQPFASASRRAERTVAGDARPAMARLPIARSSGPLAWHGAEREQA